MHHPLFFLCIASAVLALPLAQQPEDQSEVEENKNTGLSPEALTGLGLGVFTVGSKAYMRYKNPPPPKPEGQPPKGIKKWTKSIQSGIQSRVQRAKALRAKAAQAKAAQAMTAEAVKTASASNPRTRTAPPDVIHHELNEAKKKWTKEELNKFNICIGLKDDPKQPPRTPLQNLQKQVDCANMIIAERRAAAAAEAKATAKSGSEAEATSDETTSGKEGAGTTTDNKGADKGNKLPSMAFNSGRNVQGSSTAFGTPPANVVLPTLGGFSAAAVLSRLPNVASGLGALWEAGAAGLSALKFAGSSI